MKKILLITLACFLLLGVSSQAQAVILNPGDSVTAVSGTLPTSMTLLETINVNVSPVIGTISGSMLHEVYRNNADNTLLFMYQVTSVNSGTIGRVTVENYSGFLTDVFYESASLNPDVFTRNAGSGQTVGFTFNNGLVVGDTSSKMWVATDAQWYGGGDSFFINGGIAAAKVYGPTTPEPASMALLGFGLIGLAGGVLRKKVRA